MRLLIVGLVACAACAPERIDLGDGEVEELDEAAGEDVLGGNDGVDRPMDDNLHGDPLCDPSEQTCELVDPCESDDFLVLICGETEALCERCGGCLTCEHGIYAMCSPDESSVLFCEDEPCFFRESCEPSYCDGGFDQPYCVHDDSMFEMGEP